jgi:DNA repair protein RadD
MKLRYYQQEAVNSIDANSKVNGLMVMPTGAGKSIIIAEICKKLAGNVLILQPSLEILQQNKQKILNAINEEVGVYSASAKEKSVKRITLAMIKSIKDYDLFRDFKNIICDEAHLINAKAGEYCDFINYIKPNFLVGLTATPYRMKQTKLYGLQYRFLWRTRPKIFDKLLYVYQNYKIYQDGFWSKIKYLQYSYDDSNLFFDNSRIDYDENLIVKINNHNSVYKTVKEICLKTNKKRILIFATKIDEANYIASNVGGVAITSKTKNRKELLLKFENGEIRIIVNVMVFTTGFDLPILDCIILARPTMSLSLYCQMVGRGVRIHNQKDFVEVHDLCNNVKRFGKVETMELSNDYLASDTGNLIGIKPNNFEVNFGKYNGKKISEVPDDYIIWGFKNIANSNIKTIFKREAINRKLI